LMSRGYSINNLYGVNGIYGINNIYGVNSYNNYISSLTSNKTTSTSSQSNTSLLNSLYSKYLNNTASALSSKTVTSTDSDTVTATAQQNATIGSYSVKVSNLATAQTNTGTSLSANNPSVIGTGLDILRINSGTASRNISLVINDTDTNKTALTKLASAINKSGLGITASVTTDSANKASLTLESAKTGTRNAFSISDLQGNAVSATGIGTADTKAQNATYSVNGHQYTSSGNTVSLDSGKVQATLKEVGDTAVKLSVTPDTSTSSTNTYYSYINNLLSAGNYYNSSLNSGSLLDMFL
jgi:flagellar hook-associated protein 2